MTRAELLEELRFVLDDTVGPRYAWSDARLMQMLSEGQNKFCEKTGFWADKNTFTLLTVLNQQDYLIDPRIIAVRSIWDGTRKLTDGAPDDVRSEDFADNPVQSPSYYRTDLQTNYITFIEPVMAGVTLNIRAHRRALAAFNHKTGNSYDGELEIPEDFHYAPVEYAAAKAFNDHDRELQDPVKAADHIANFERYVTDGRTAYRRITGEYIDVVPNPLYVV